MKFLKNNLKLVVGIIIGAVLISGLSVYATGQYFATQINYTRNNETISVAEALNDLYLKSKTVDNCKYFEFDHEANTQFNYDFGFVPSKFLAIFEDDGYKVIISYNTFNNSLYAAYAEDGSSSSNITSYCSMDSTKLKSNLPTNWGVYQDSYKIYVYASK